MTKEMSAEQVCAWLQKFRASVLEYPFGPQAAVFKVGGRIFALVAMDGPEFVTLKVEPEEGVALRAQYDSIREGYYMNKRHWISVDLGPEVPVEELRELLENSHSLVVSTLTKKQQTGMTP